MPVYQSLAMALRGHFHKPFASLPAAAQRRINEDFFPWPWDAKSPRERVHRAKQWDYENDPARRELREGIEALTNPDSPAYSLTETQRLRGDFLPVPRNVHRQIDQPPLPWESPQENVGLKRAAAKVKESPIARGDRLLKAFNDEVKASGDHGALARLASRERLLNPKADRSSIGKQIKAAKARAAKEKQGAGMFGSLVKRG